MKLCDDPQAPRSTGAQGLIILTPMIWPCYCTINQSENLTQADHLCWDSPSSVQFSSFQLLSHVQLFATSWTAAFQASLFFTNSQSLLTHVHWISEPSNHLILYHPLLLLPSVFPSIRVFSNELVLLVMWPKNRSFSFSISPSNEYSMLSFRTDWFDLLAVQGTLKSLL